MSESSHASDGDRAPVSGSCERCGCALGFAASRRGDTWFCCGACGGSGRCTCGCKPELQREANSDQYVPTRRMFSSRRPDELRTRDDYEGKNRAFPFSDRNRGR